MADPLAMLDAAVAGLGGEYRDGQHELTAAIADALFAQPVGPAFDRHLERLEVFAKESETGDRGDLSDTISDASWAAVSCAPAECPGRGNCKDGEDCFAERARDRAHEATILVVNH